MKYYFITGTSSGIGQALTTELLKQNDVRVFGIARRQNLLDENYVPVPLNLAHINEVESFRFPTLENPESIVLINNAGQIGDIKPMGKSNNKAIADLFTVNVTAVAILMNNFIEKYQDIPTQKIILNVSSGAGKNPIEGWATYCASKAAVDLLSLTTFTEQERETHPIQIYSVAPGVVDTQMQESIRNSNEKDFSSHKHFVELKANNELTNPTEVAEKYIRILTNTPDFKACIFSLRDVN
ncbi:MAG: benzil reductase ((S)-benzoin forming) [Salibacteraceae bacterium]|jgi:benzil reductase ((S)-benzoin forming)